MSKAISLVVAVALNIASAASAHTMPVAFFGPWQAELITPIADVVYSGPQVRHYRGYRGGYPYYPYYAGSYRKTHANFCPFGSYVACVYSGTYCWDRCY
jgi:hypothetical protein